MTPEQWQKVEAVLQEALDRPPQERASFLNAACSGDERLLDEATSLVNAYDEAGDFIEQPAMAQDARILLGGDIAIRLDTRLVLTKLSGGWAPVVWVKFISRRIRGSIVWSL